METVIYTIASMSIFFSLLPIPSFISLKLQDTGLGLILGRGCKYKDKIIAYDRVFQSPWGFLEIIV